ncbi:hypothetical protein [Kribbella sp. VKM Ac-2569]|uniref:hypothetical protein n=1 Tax=Kribbella sp. VKM Ac-2569 TaxID=2512220 RepID=UPI00102BF3E9|nr:hypothetical protein [Kribbella sp. VKM Ac-2569]
MRDLRRAHVAGTLLLSRPPEQHLDRERLLTATSRKAGKGSVNPRGEQLLEKSPKGRNRLDGGEGEVESGDRLFRLLAHLALANLLDLDLPLGLVQVWVERADLVSNPFCRAFECGVAPSAGPERGRKRSHLLLADLATRDELASAESAQPTAHPSP